MNRCGRRTGRAVAFAALVATASTVVIEADKVFDTKSGLRAWVDVDTPADAQTITSSRGDTWELVFSDEFNVPGRDFSAGKDPIWTALDLPDGVNAALEYYSPNMTDTHTESDGRGVFRIKVQEEDNLTFSVFNAYTHPPGYEDISMYYRSGMVQSWNKFCFQGGLMEVVAQLPGAVSKASGNPDLGNKNDRVENNAYYPTWPGIWLLGNLGRALFTGSTNRMWPWSYDECNEDLSSMQRISACNSNPGYGLNPNQGRGAPEIDLLEGGGVAISTSIQIAPGMPDDFRMPAPNGTDFVYCIYGGTCETTGANYPGVPTAYYNSRGHKSWYQGLRYAPNTICTPESDQIQNPTAVKNSVAKGITSNTCEGTNTCPASYDANCDLGLIDGKGTRYWGVNDKGGCMPKINAYMGAYLCDPDNNNSKCSSPLTGGISKSGMMDPFNYQMDAISANSPLQLGAYTDYVKYQIEWVMGAEGYVRWIIEDIPIFEIPAESLENPPQDSANSNPRKLMIEEPMYIIFNVALSTSWGAVPPNAGKPCRGDGDDAKVNKICDDFPMYMKIDYIRVYQDVSSNSSMAIGCDPKTHPTKQWIEGHIEQYENADNPWIEVVGGANCNVDDDCSVATVGNAAIITGECRNSTCYCLSSTSWGGPRCTTARIDTEEGFGPSLPVSATYAGVFAVLFLFVIYKIVHTKRVKKLLEGEAFSKSHAREMEDVSMSQSFPAPTSNDPKVV